MFGGGGEEERIRPFNEHEILHFDIHMSIEIMMKVATTLILDMLIILY